MVARPNYALTQKLRKAHWLVRQGLFVFIGVASWFGIIAPRRWPADPVFNRPGVLILFGGLLAAILLSAVAAGLAWLTPLSATGRMDIADTLRGASLLLGVLAWRSGYRFYARR